MSIEKATFGAGCFWGVEHILRQIPGVIETEVGYMGGKSENPSYREVCSGMTGHAEVVQVSFDSDKVSYDTLLDYFWRLHDPTTLNRQGPDIGSQYRSVIFFHNEEQEHKAIASKKNFDQSGVFSQKAVTEITPATTFYPAEDYHQDYFENHQTPVCHILREK